MYFFFFFNDTATTEIYTLSLHDALPIYQVAFGRRVDRSTSLTWPPPPAEVALDRIPEVRAERVGPPGGERSEEHTSELQSPCNLVCRLLLEKKKVPFLF